MTAANTSLSRARATGHEPSLGRTLLHRYATVATMATFTVVAVTGVLIFYHIGNRYLMGLHEWMGMAFVVAASLHLLRHAPSMTKLLAAARTRWALVLAVLVAIAFIVAAALNPAPGKHLRRNAELPQDAPISAPAQTMGTDVEQG